MEKRRIFSSFAVDSSLFFYRNGRRPTENSFYPYRNSGSHQIPFLSNFHFFKNFFQQKNFKIEKEKKKKKYYFRELRVLNMLWIPISYFLMVLFKTQTFR